MPTEDKVLRRLARAEESASLIRITRSPRHADRIDGFVVALTPKWVLISQVGDGGYFNGLVAVRVKHISKIVSSSSFEARFARRQPEWPPRAPADLDLSSTRCLVMSLGQVAPIIGIEQEDRYKSSMTWIGAVQEIGHGWVWLREVRPDATWKKDPLGYKLHRITKVVVADRYQTALAVVAGNGRESKTPTGR